MVHFFKKCQVYNIIHRIENETMLLYDKTLQLCNTVMFFNDFLLHFIMIIRGTTVLTTFSRVFWKHVDHTPTVE